MTAPPSPPNRRRRRIVITMAVLQVGLCWWYWPRSDARFVGKWALSRTAQGRPIQTWRMSRNGGGWAHSISSDRSTCLSWSVSGNTLRLGYRWHSADGLLFKLQRFLQSHTGWHPWVMAGEQWEIRELSTDSIVLWPDGAGESYTLTRIPE